MDDTPELIEILKGLGRHWLQLHEQTYGNSRKTEVTEAEDQAYWSHPLDSFCAEIENRTGIHRDWLTEAAKRLNSLNGLRPYRSSVGNGDLPDLTPIAPKLKELDRDGTTKRLWQTLLAEHREVLVDAKMIGELPAGSASKRLTPMPLAEEPAHAARTEPIDRSRVLAAMQDEAMLNHIDLAKILDLEEQPLRKRLERWRKKNIDGWEEVREVKLRQPRFLYKVGAIRAVLREAIESKASG